MTAVERQRRRRGRLNERAEFESLVTRLSAMTDFSELQPGEGVNAYERAGYLRDSIYNLGDPELQLPPLEEFARLFMYTDRDEYEDWLCRFEKAILHLQVLLAIVRLSPPEEEPIEAEEEDVED